MTKKKAAPKPSNEEKAKPTIVVQNLVVRPTNRKSQDIGTWRNALRSAEASMPRRVELYDLYEDILLDGHLRSVWEKRVMGVTNADWQFVSQDGKIIDQVNDLIDTPEFEDLVIEIMNAKGWGYSVMEFLGFRPDGFNMFSIPRKHVRPLTGIITTEQSGDTGTNIREGIYLNTVMEVGKARDLGLFLSAAQYVIYKRGAFGDWSQFSELFGMPFRKGKYDGYDESQRAKLEEALANMGGAGYVVIPEGSDIEFMENKSKADGKLYDYLKDACNKELSKLILGQTETTESSSSSGYAQSQTHSETEKDIQKADRKFVRRILNRHFIHILEANGVKTQGGRFKVLGEGEERVPKKTKLDMHLKMVKELNLPVDDDFFYNEYDLPKPDNYDQLKREREEAAKAAKTALTPPAQDPKPNTKPGKKSKKPGAEIEELSSSSPGILENIRQATEGYLEKLNRFFD